jgi:3-dehydroquinate synthase
MQERTLEVGLGDRSYPIRIGSGTIACAGDVLAREGARRAVIVTNETVAAHWLAPLRASLAARGVAVEVVLVPDGEAHKSLATLNDVLTRMIECHAERRSLVVALGGGVIGDLAGFAAAILRRGVRFVQIPTSLLAQVDSSVGGKTGIDTPQGKNLIGAFHQPGLVLADTDVLGTLPERELRAGYAEVAKYGLLGDAPFFAWLEKNHPSVFALDPGPLTHAVETSVKAKAGIVGRDETEQGERALLNLGHTFGHAFEAWCGYSDLLLHGEAISNGMCIAFRFSAAQGFCDAAEADRVAAHFRAVGLPTRISDIPGDKPDLDAMMKLMAQDKKVRHGKLTFILARGIGEAFIARDVPADTVRGFLAGEIGA